MLVTWKYRPRDTFVQRLDPRARLIFLACMILSVFQFWDIRFLLPFFVISLTLYFLARIEWHDVRRAWIFILLFVTFIVGLNALLSGRGGPLEVLQDVSSRVIFQARILTVPLVGWTWMIRITVVKAVFAATQLVRILTMAILAIPIPYTFDPSRYGVAFRQLGLPDKAAYTMDLAFRFVPTLGRDFGITLDAQRARGYEVDRLKGGIISRLRRLAPLVVPVTMLAIVGGEDVVDAMDLRAFGTRPRTWTVRLEYSTMDRLFIAFGVLLLVVSVTLNMLGYGDFWVPPSLLAGG